MKKAVSSAQVHLVLWATVVATLSLANDQMEHRHTHDSIIMFNKFTVSVASNITVSVEVLPDAKELAEELSVVPNGATIDPLGHTTVVFEITGVAVYNSTTFPILFVIPVTTYIDLPITGSVAQTLKIAPGSSIAVQGLTTTITRLLYGFSKQTFPQLSRVVISKISPEWPYTMTELASIAVPSLI